MSVGEYSQRQNAFAADDIFLDIKVGSTVERTALSTANRSIRKQKGNSVWFSTSTVRTHPSENTLKSNLTFTQSDSFK